jgi:hypothetical protein
MENDQWIVLQTSPGKIRIPVKAIGPFGSCADAIKFAADMMDKDGSKVYSVAELNPPA